MSAALTHSGSHASTSSDSHEIKPSPSTEKSTDLPLERSELAVVYEQSQKERLSSIFAIICSGFALISDGLQNNIMVSLWRERNFRASALFFVIARRHSWIFARQSD